MKVKEKLVFQCCFVAVSIAFLPNRFSGNEKDYSHESITDKAMYIAAAKYISTYLQPGVYNQSDFNALKIVKGFFKKDFTSLRNFENAVKQVISGNNGAQKNYGGNAMYTMNADQILEGNIKLQLKRDSIIKLAKSAQPDWNFIRKAVGEYLMTLQMFYSNTNWIELYGQTVNKNLGVRGLYVQKVESLSVATCKDCTQQSPTNIPAYPAYSAYVSQLIRCARASSEYRSFLHSGQSLSCENNLITTLLTSGYRSGQDIKKPQGIWASGVGKCSHGGNRDSTRFTPAIGGINKETSDPNLSPHFYLHKEAGEAAIKATVHFLTGAGSGLLDVIGAALFGDFISIHTTCFNCLDPALSLTFVIDDTGSMGNDIFAVRQKAIDIVNKAYSGDGVANYVLATFNDPVKSTVKITKNGETMKSWLKDLRANGGGDCPEYAMHGLLAGIEASVHGSCLFFFTDADPKDPELEPQVASAANAKDIKLMLFLRGQCSGELETDNTTNPKCIQRQRPEPANRRKRALTGAWGMFGSLISATSASAVKVPEGQIAETIGDVIDGSTNIDPVFIADFLMDSTMENHTFPIDSFINLFTVKIIGEVSSSNVNLIRPDGITEDYSSDSATRDNIGKGTIIISIVKPSKGIWKLRKTGSHTWKVIVKGQGSVDFTSSLLEDIDGVKYPISGLSPIAGSNISMGIRVNGLDNDSSVDEVILRSKTDTPIVTLQLNDSMHDSPILLHADTYTPSQPFRITVQGTDGDGYTFRRTSQDMIIPVTANLEIMTILNDLVKGEITPIYYKVTNTGSISEVFDIIAKDTLNYLNHPTRHSVTITPNVPFESYFNITGTKELSVTLVRIYLKQRQTTLQSKTLSLMVAETVPPSFETVSRSKDCTEDDMNSLNCSEAEWWIYTNIHFSRPSLKISVTSPAVTLTHSALNDTGIASAIISGDCCASVTKIVATDTSNIAEFSLDFSGGFEFKHIEPKVKYVTPPMFTISSNSENCLLKYMNTENCTHGHWWAAVVVTFDSVGTSIYVSPTPDVSKDDNTSHTIIDHEDLKSMKRVINANISGLCCEYSAMIVATDLYGWTSKLFLDFSGGLEYYKEVMMPNNVRSTLRMKYAGVLCTVLRCPLVNIHVTGVSTEPGGAYSSGAPGLTQFTCLLNFAILNVLRIYGYGIPLIVCRRIADVAFVLDASRSIGPTAFNYERQFVVKILQAFDVGPDRSRFAAITFSDSVRSEFYFNTYTTQDQISTAITAIDYADGPATLIYGALRYTHDHVFTRASGDRDDVPDIVILITDGETNPGKTDRKTRREGLAATKMQADRLKAMGVSVFTIGVGPYINRQELQKAASQPYEKYYLQVANYRELNTDAVVQRVKNLLCKVLPGPRPPCPSAKQILESPMSRASPGPGK